MFHLHVLKYKWVEFKKRRNRWEVTKKQKRLLMEKSEEKQKAD